MSVNVGVDAEVTQLPRFHCPSLTFRKSLSVLDFCRFGDGAVLRRQLDQSRGSANIRSARENMCITFYRYNDH